MWQGLMLCGPVAFIVVCVATDNIILAFYSIVCIAGIVSCVLGAGEHYMGWSLGIGESISAVIIIGLSVDFTLHLAHMFAETDKPDRESRVAHAAVTMGVTVIAGALTTMGAGAVMLFCQMTFFTKVRAWPVLQLQANRSFTLCRCTDGPLDCDDNFLQHPHGAAAVHGVVCCPGARRARRNHLSHGQVCVRVGQGRAKLGAVRGRLLCICIWFFVNNICRAVVLSLVRAFLSMHTYPFLVATHRCTQRYNPHCPRLPRPDFAPAFARLCTCVSSSWLRLVRNTMSSTACFR